MRLVFASAMALALAACASAKQYEGPARPESQLAIVLKPESIPCNLTVVEGKFGGFFGGPTRLELLPGPHTLGVAFASVGATSATHDLTINAVAGHTYEVHCMGASGNGWRAWIEDTATKQVVSQQGK
jgi:hypothetical protein